MADTGEGLTPEECERLFTPYYTTKQHGTGLGLAIVQSVVGDHTGTIAVESERGRRRDVCHRRCRSGRGEGMSAKAKILIVDDEANTLASLARAFRLAGHEAMVCDNAARALELAKSQPFDLILSDVVMPGGRPRAARRSEGGGRGGAGGDDVRAGAHRDGGARHAAGRAGFSGEAALHRQAAGHGRERAQADAPGDENRDLRSRVGKHELVWTGETMRRVMAQMERVAASETRVCIYGETGTGKELVARTLHEKSPRARGPFVTLNCAAVPAELIESELFGHEKGSFTGAAQRHIGQVRAGAPRHAVPGRDRRHAAGDAGQAAARAGGGRGGAHRRGQAHHGRCARGRGHASQPRGTGRAGGFRQDLYHRVFVFPVSCRRCASAARTYRRWWSTSRGRWRAERLEAGPFTAEAIEALQDTVAGQCARAAQRGGAAAAAGRR